MGDPAASFDPAASLTPQPLPMIMITHNGVSRYINAEHTGQLK
jgi:hypothetical protein